jgi:PAS domain S-box-containing protein
MSSEINYNGRICSMGIFRDITKRLELEDKIKRETYFKETLLKESSDGIVILDERGKVIEFNNAFKNMLGYSYEEMIHLSVWDWEFDYLRDEVKSLISIVDEKGLHFVRTHKRKDGSTYKAEISTNATTFNNIKLIFCIVRDISERENLITELIQKDIEVKKAQRIAKISNWSWDFDTKEVVWSDEFFEIVKYNKGTIPKTLKEAKFLFTKNSFELINKSIDEAVELEKIFEVELDLICSDSKIKTVNLKGEPKFDKKKVFTGFRGILQDITESKLQQLELIKAKEEAEKADRLKSEFLSQMSHEIRTPINAILSFIGLIREEVSAYMNEDILESFQIIDNASRRLIRTIDLILNMSSIQAGSYDYSPHDINIDKILFDLVVEFKPIAINKNLQIRMDFKGNNFIRCLDEYSIRQIFSNLLDNAIKYTNSGEINIKVYFTDGNCVVEIIDTGIGISSDKIEEIFKPFAQEEQGYTRKFEGNGLGLALVKKYCEMNNAKIEVISKKGEGSIFRVIV